MRAPRPPEERLQAALRPKSTPTPSPALDYLLGHAWATPALATVAKAGRRRRARRQTRPSLSTATRRGIRSECCLRCAATQCQAVDCWFARPAGGAAGHWMVWAEGQRMPARDGPEGWTAAEASKLSIAGSAGRRRSSGRCCSPRPYSFFVLWRVFWPLRGRCEAAPNFEIARCENSATSCRPPTRQICQQRLAETKGHTASVAFTSQPDEEPGEGAGTRHAKEKNERARERATAARRA